MIKTELLKDGKLIKHYSDTECKLIQVETGKKYTAPIDTVPCKYTYEEFIDGNNEDITGDEFLKMVEEVL